MQCAQCGAIADRMEICEFCRKPVCDECKVEDYAGNVSDLQEPEVRHARCVGYWTPRWSRRAQQARQKKGDH
jgi:hypothetical protein